jgi:hypothetical protein
MQQVLYANATAPVIEGIARRDSGANFKEDLAIGFLYTNGHGHGLWGRLCAVSLGTCAVCSSIFALSGDLYVTLV